MKDTQLQFKVSKEEKELIMKAIEKATQETGVPLSKSAYFIWISKRYLNDTKSKG